MRSAEGEEGASEACASKAASEAAPGTGTHPFPKGGAGLTLSRTRVQWER